MTLSLCMIVKNEQDVLSRALSSAYVFADEIIVVDTGSTDGTKKVARSFTDKVYDFAWCDDFSAARNYAFEKATCDYRMWLDADDVVPMPSARAIKRLMTDMNEDIDIVMLPYVLETDGKGAAKYAFYRERILKNKKDLMFGGRVHEAVSLRGNMIKKDIPIYHEKPSGRTGGTRNLDIYKKMKASGEKFTPRDRYYYARELFHHGEVAAAEKEFRGFLTTPDGFYVNKIDACLMLSRCLQKRGERAAAYVALFDSFLYGLPTGEVACEIAFMYFADGKYAMSAYWFERALTAKPDMESGAFIDRDKYKFLPAVWLSVCYDKLGKPRMAYYYHCLARKINPDHPSVIANQKYFEKLGF